MYIPLLVVKHFVSTRLRNSLHVFHTHVYQIPILSYVGMAYLAYPLWIKFCFTVLHHMQL